MRWTSALAAVFVLVALDPAPNLTSFTSGPDAPATDAMVSDFRHGRARVDGLVWSGSGVSVRIGRLSVSSAPLFAFIAPAFAETGTVSAENVSVTEGEVTYAISRIDLVGASLTRAGLAQLLDPKDPRPLAERLGALSAVAIVIPDLTVTRSGGAPQKSIYKGIELKGIGKGQAASAAVAGATFSKLDPLTGETRGASGAMNAAAVDLALASKILAGANVSPAESLAPLCESASIEAIDVANARQGAELSVKTFRSGPIKARASIRRSPEGVASSTRTSLGDVLDLIEISGFDAAGLRLRLGGDARPSASVLLQRVSGSMQAPARTASFEGQNATIETAGARFAADSFSAEGVGLTAFEKMLPPTQHRAETAASGTIQQIRLAGVAASWDRAQTPDDNGGKAEASADRLALRWETAQNGGPWRVDAALDHMKVQPADIASGPFPYLAALGYSSLDLSSRLDLSWNEASRELEISSLSASAPEAGTASVAASFENASGNLLSPDPQIASAAALGLVMKRLDLRLDNAGLFERALAADAKTQKKTVDQVRQGYLAASATALPAVLGGGASAKMLGSALAKFVAHPKSLHITVKAPEGFGAIDLEDGPGRLLANLEIEASANQ